MPPERSTRISIVEHSLADIHERLDELPDSPETRELVARALDYEAIVATWRDHPPPEETRHAFLRKVLDLNVGVIRLAADAGVEVGAVPESADDEDDEFPRPIGGEKGER
jgi:hypothetical protein